MEIKNIQTPALIVDENVFLQNSINMSKILSGKTLKLRPHFKSHKCAEIARFQVENGAIGLTCAKLSEAIDLVDSGVENVLVANQIVEKSKIATLAHLANCANLTVCVDDIQNVKDLENACGLMSSTLNVLIEYEIGMERCGVSSKEEVLNLARFISSCKHLKFKGVQAYAGHLSHEISGEDRLLETSKNTEKLKELIAYLNENGIEVETLSGGSTGTSIIKAEQGLYTELQAGSYLFMDATYKDLNLPFKNSLYIVATVVSVTSNITVVDAGVKSCGIDQGMPLGVGFTYEKIVASEEHFQLHNPSKKFNVGDKVLLIPAHCCSTVNLYDKIYFVKDGKITRRVQVSARGCSK
ncbi:MAG: alanine racemase [Clostridia bacterium]|nr:alanine racemase [Clostridia bacterium]